MSDDRKSIDNKVKNEEALIEELKAQLNNFRFLAGFIIAIIVFSTWFYHAVENWKWLDSIYYVVVTLGTVGYGDFTPTTDVAKLYTIVLIVVGISTFGFFAQQLIKRQQLRALERQIKDIDKSKK